ncbi:HlyD family secretion protein [Roseivivax sp. GX 12232]|uniref:HlyD family secretion protein n=1 Tax=Roseivivax sp. GX 12232 TaxID=2900547 RepID=UPI001E32BC60|nr:HlyD family secretion protein [Roseivivax sp. GX 12232]MCE0503911.1 HlyD family secretion protein [Roseivivax sp. GX 12232]
MSRIGWLGLGLTLVALLLFAVANWLAGQELTPRHSYYGSLRPTGEPHPVALPPHALLKEVVVTEGAQVARGETVAIYDLPALRAEAEALELERLHDSVLQQCLLADQKPRMPGAFAPEDAKAAAMARAVRSCRELRQAEEDIRAHHAARRRAVEAERAVLARYLDSLTGAPRTLGPDTVSPAAGTATTEPRRALALALAAQRLAARLTEITAEESTALRTHHAQITARLAFLAESTQANMLRAKALARHIKTPRLQAPVTGRIARIRPLAQSAPTASSLPLLDMTTDATPGFTVTIDLPASRLPNISRGQSVEVQLVNLPRQWPELTGQISRIEAQKNGRLQARIALSKEDTDLLAHPENGIGLISTYTAAEVRLVHAARPLEQAATRAILNILPPATAWFGSRLGALRLQSQEMPALF